MKNLFKAITFLLCLSISASSFAFSGGSNGGSGGGGGGVPGNTLAPNNYATSIDPTGLISGSQVNFTNLAGTASASQLPNPSATTLGGVQSTAVVAHNVVTGISTGGVPSKGQLACGDLSDFGTGCSATLAPVATSGSASDLSVGTVPAARGGVGAISGIVKANAGVASQAVSGTDYQPAIAGNTLSSHIVANSVNSAGTISGIQLSCGDLADFGTGCSATLAAVATSGSATDLGSGTINTARLPAAVQLGTGGSSSGSVKLCNATGSNCPTVGSQASSGSATVFNVPTSNGTSKYPLVTDGSGNTSWSNNFALGLTDAPMWMHFLGDGSEADPGPSSFSIQGTHWYSALTINNGQTITVTNTVSSAGTATDKPQAALIAYVTGTCTIAGTIDAHTNGITTTGTGGGSGASGGFGAAGSSAGADVNLPGGAGVIALVKGGAAQSSSGQAGNGGTSPTASAQKLVFGAAMPYGNCGGSPGSAGGSSGGASGSGGGCVWLLCGTMNFTGTINVSGNAGGAGGSNTGGGGGGGGGIILLVSKNMTNSGTLTTNGGAGGTGATGTGGNGGLGGAGYSKVITLN